MDKINFAKYIDHTNLKPTATKKDIQKLCSEALKFGFCSVCVNPFWVKYASKLLKNSEVKIAAVIGFPLGANSSEIKKQEALEAAKNGATELDMVINQGLFKMGEYDKVLDDINGVCKAGTTVKVIIETSNLSLGEIEKLCEIVNQSNAQFIKTSTGFIGDGAKLEHIKLMKQKMQSNKFVKASGGIRDAKTFIDMINAGADRIGTSSGVKILSEL